MNDLTLLLAIDNLNQHTAWFKAGSIGELSLDRTEWERLGSPSRLYAALTLDAPWIEPEKPAEPADVTFENGSVHRPESEPGPWTEHGHSIPGVTVAGPRPAELKVARCGGVRLCKDCQRDAAILAHERGL